MTAHPRKDVRSLWLSVLSQNPVGLSPTKRVPSYPDTRPTPKRRVAALCGSTLYAYLNLFGCKVSNNFQTCKFFSHFFLQTLNSNFRYLQISRKALSSDGFIKALNGVPLAVISLTMKSCRRCSTTAILKSFHVAHH